MADRDWYPASMDAIAAWWLNFMARRGDFEVKYPILNTMKSALEADNTWMQHWVAARHAADNLSQQLTRYFNTIAGSDASLDPPSPIVWTLPGAVPAEVPPGIEKRIRDVRREVVGSTDYAKADGEAMGFEAPVPAPDDPSTLTPDFTLKTLANFELGVTFRKLGMDALKFQFRHPGGQWLPAGFLITSPGSFAVTPSTPGQAEQIEVRAIYMQKNNETGNYSDAKPAFIAA